MLELGEDVEEALVLSEAMLGAGLAGAEEALEDLDAHRGIVDGVETLLEHLGGARGDLGIAEQLRRQLERLRVVR